MRAVPTTLCWLCLMLATACQTGDRGGDVPADSEQVATLDDVTNGLVANQPANDPQGNLPAASFRGAASGEAAGSTQPARERLLIQRGQLRLEVARPDDAIAEFLAKVSEWGGYLHSQQGNTLVVRVPAAQFDAAFAAGRSMGRVLTESREANDVTEEFVDLGIRLDTARKARDRLLEVLQRAEKVEDILRVEAELRRLTDEIERLEGRRKFLADQVALATLQVAFQAPTEPPPGRRRREASRFRWMERVGPDAVMGGF